MREARSEATSRRLLVIELCRLRSSLRSSSNLTSVAFVGRWKKLGNTWLVKMMERVCDERSES